MNFIIWIFSFLIGHVIAATICNMTWTPFNLRWIVRWLEKHT